MVEEWDHEIEDRDKLMKISFDFDYTLMFPSDSSEIGKPNKEFVNKFKEHMVSGDDVYIVTSRNENDLSRNQIIKFCQKNGLKPKQIIATNGNSKAPTLQNLGIELHYDDDPQERSDVESVGIKTVDAMNGAAQRAFNEYYGMDEGQSFKQFSRYNDDNFIRPIALVDEDNTKIPKNIWFHGDPNQRKHFCDQRMDREAFVQDPNANGPGIYFTKDYTQARGYAYPDGYVYTVKINPNAGFIIKEKDKAKDHKDFLFTLIKKAQEHNPETVYYAVTDYGHEIMNVDDVTDDHIKSIIENYLSNFNLISAAVSVYKEFFGREANPWTKAMKETGALGFLQKQPDTDHLIVYDCDAIEILKEEKYVQDLNEKKTFKSAFNEGSRGLKKQLRKKVSYAKKKISPKEMSGKQIQRSFKDAFETAQQMNKKGGGTTTVYHMIMPERMESKGFSLEDTFKFLFSKSPREISVSVEKGVWDVKRSIILEGDGKLTSYFETDVYTTIDDYGNKVPLEPYRDTNSHSWDEGTVRLSDVTWDTVYVPDEFSSNEYKEVQKLADEYDIWIKHPSQSYSGALKSTQDFEYDIENIEQEIGWLFSGTQQTWNEIDRQLQKLKDSLGHDKFFETFEEEYDALNDIYEEISSDIAEVIPERVTQTNEEFMEEMEIALQHLKDVEEKLKQIESSIEDKKDELVEPVYEKKTFKSFFESVELKEKRGIDLEIPKGTVLYHGTGEQFDKSKVLPGGYDRLFWTTDSKDVARSYIPSAGGFLHTSTDHITTPTKDSHTQNVQKKLGIDYDYDNVEFDNSGRAKSYFPAPIFADIEEKSRKLFRRLYELDKQMNKYREIFKNDEYEEKYTDEEIDKLFKEYETVEEEYIKAKEENNNFYKEKMKNDIVNKKLKELGYEPEGGSSYNGDYRWKLRFSNGELMPNDYRFKGRLLIVKLKKDMKIYDITLGGEREADLMDLDYHDLETFNKVEKEGYDGVKITDFAQTERYGNLMHTSIGFFKHAIPDLDIDEVEAEHPDKIEGMLFESKNKKVRVGVVGYSDDKFDKEKAKELVKKAFDKIEDEYGNNITIVSGYTALGISLLAYKEAVRRKWKTKGIACKKADEFEKFPVDSYEIVGDEWGDESETFLNDIDVLVKIGGGDQSKEEAKEAKKDGLKVFRYNLEEK